MASGLFAMLKDPRMINRRIQDNGNYQGASQILTGDEKEYCHVLTKEEEKSFVNYLLNRNRCGQGLNEKQAEGVVLNILRTRDTVNKKGGRKFIGLSENAKTCLRTKKVGRSFFRRLRAAHPQLKKKVTNKVSVNRGLKCTRDMAISHLDELA